MACKCNASEKCSSRLMNKLLRALKGSYLMNYLSLNCDTTIEINLLELCGEIYQNSSSLNYHHIELNINKTFESVKKV